MPKIENTIAVVVCLGVAIYLVGMTRSPSSFADCESANNIDVVVSLARGNCGRASVWASH